MKFTSAVSVFSLVTLIALASAAPSPRPPFWGAGNNSDGDTSTYSFDHPRTGGYRGGLWGPRTRTTAGGDQAPTTSTLASTSTERAKSTSSSAAAPSSSGNSSNKPSGSKSALPPTPTPDQAAVAGALYFTTNNPDANNVIVGTIRADGNVTFAHTYSTQGQGEHINDGGRMGADATFSNNLLVVHQGRNLLATANTKSHTVVLFSIDESDATKLRMLGAPVQSGGEYPSSLVFDKAGDHLCVMNAGAVATVMCYDVTDGGLQPQASSVRTIPGYNQTTPPTGPSNTASAIAFTEDESALVVAVKGTLEPPAPGFLAAWPVEGDGVLAQDPTVIPNVDGHGLSFSLTPIPGKNAFLAADFSSAVDVFDFATSLRDVSGISGTSSLDIDGKLSLCWSTYSEGVDRYYLAAPPSNLVVEIELDDQLKPTIISNHKIIDGAFNVDLVASTVQGKDYIFTLLTNTLSVGVLAIDGPGKTHLIGATDFTNALADANAPIRPNYMQGLAVYLK